LARALDVPFNVMRAWRDMDELPQEVKEQEQRASIVFLRGQGLARHSLGPYFDPKAWEQSKYPPDPKELSVMERLEEEGIYLPELLDPRFWDYPPIERRSSFRGLEGLMDENRRFKEWKARQ
jgi:hypothetical protein